MFFDRIDGNIIMNELSNRMKCKGKSNVLFIDNLIGNGKEEKKIYIFSGKKK